MLKILQKKSVFKFLSVVIFVSAIFLLNNNKDIKAAQTRSNNWYDYNDQYMGPLQWTGYTPGRSKVGYENYVNFYVSSFKSTTGVSVWPAFYHNNQVGYKYDFVSPWNPLGDGKLYYFDNIQSMGPQPGWFVKIGYHNSEYRLHHAYMSGSINYN